MWVLPSDIFSYERLILLSRRASQRTYKKAVKYFEILRPFPRHKNCPLFRKFCGHGPLKGLCSQVRRNERFVTKSRQTNRIHTSIPHSGTRSHLLNTTIRSQTRALASGEEAAACWDSRTRSERHPFNAPGRIDHISDVLPKGSDPETQAGRKG